MVPLKIDYLPVDKLRPYERNARTHSAEQVSQIAESIRAFGWTNPILIDEDNEIIAGHGRLAAALELGMTEVPVIRLEGLTVPQRRALALADNKLALNAGWDEKLLAAELSGLDAQLRASVGFSADELLQLMNGLPHGQSQGAGSLAEKFGIAPFSVLNAREGWWQDRKRAWLALGIESELGRGESSSTGLNHGGSPLPGTTARETLDRKRKANAIPGGLPMLGGDGNPAAVNAWRAKKKKTANATPGGSCLRPAADQAIG